MKYRIRHQNPTFAIILLFCILLVFASAFFNTIVPIWVLEVHFAVILLTVLLSLIDTTVGVTVIGEDSYMIIKSLWRRRRIDFDQITDVTTKRYKRRRRYRYDIRMKMTINLSNGKKIVLNDNAGEFRGVSSFMRSTPYDKPDEEVPLYQVCQMIRSKIGDNSYYYE